MATAKNAVVAGDYLGCRVFRMSASLAYISGTMKRMEDVFLTPETVQRYDVMTGDKIRAGNSLLLVGPLDPGILMRLRLHASEEMQKKGIFTIAVKFTDGKLSLLEVDERIYSAFMRRMQG